MSDCDATFDVEVLKRVLLRPVAREIDICRMYGQGRTAKEIADLMRMSERGVRGVIERARRKIARELIP